MRSILKIWVYSNIHISFIAFLLSIETNYLLGIPRELKSPLFVFFSTLFIYNLGYYRAILFGDEAQRFHAEWMRKNRSYWIFSLLISLLAIIYLFSSFSYPAQIAIIALSIVSLFYIIHDIRIKGITLSIRNIPYVKTVIVSLIWTLITVLPQLLDTNLLVEDLQWKALIMERFLFILPITLMFDIRDLNSDPENLQTIPRLVGVGKTKIFASVSLIIAYFFLLKLNIPAISQFAMLILYLLMIVSILFSNDKKSEFYYSAWLDGLMAFHAIIIILPFIA